MEYEVKVSATNYKKNDPAIYWGDYHCNDVIDDLRENHDIVDFQVTGVFCDPKTSEILIAIGFKNKVDAMVCRLIYGIQI